MHRVQPGRCARCGQSRYRAAGVNSATPDPETSRAFFGWLATQEQDVLRRHIPCVLRHILHGNGPEHWAPSFTETPSIPMDNQQNGAILLVPRPRKGNRLATYSANGASSAPHNFYAVNPTMMRFSRSVRYSWCLTATSCPTAQAWTPPPLDASSVNSAVRSSFRHLSKRVRLSSGSLWS